MALALVPNHEQLKARVASLSDQVCHVGHFEDDANTANFSTDVTGSPVPAPREPAEARSGFLSPADLLHSALKSAKKQNRLRPPTDYATHDASSSVTVSSAAASATAVVEAEAEASPVADVCARGRMLLNEAYDEDDAPQMTNQHHERSEDEADEEEEKSEAATASARSTQARTRVRRSLTPPTPPPAPASASFAEAIIKSEAPSPSSNTAKEAAKAKAKKRAMVAKKRVQSVDVNGEIRNLLERQVVDILNKGDETALLQLHGVGVKRAQYILEYRQDSRFNQIADLKVRRRSYFLRICAHCFHRSHASHRVSSNRLSRARCFSPASLQHHSTSGYQVSKSHGFRAKWSAPSSWPGELDRAHVLAGHVAPLPQTHNSGAACGVANGQACAFIDIVYLARTSVSGGF